MTNNNIWLIILPILLFGFKYFLPIICEKVFSDHSLQGIWAKTAEELIQFPVDLLFIAIGYTIPRISDTISAISSLKTNDLLEANELISLNNQYCQNLINYIIRCFIMLIALPVFVLLTKYAIKLGDEQKGPKQILLVIVLYALSVCAIVYSLFLYQ